MASLQVNIVFQKSFGFDLTQKLTRVKWHREQSNLFSMLNLAAAPSIGFAPALNAPAVALRAPAVQMAAIDDLESVAKEQVHQPLPHSAEPNAGRSDSLDGKCQAGSARASRGRTCLTVRAFCPIPADRTR